MQFLYSTEPTPGQPTRISSSPRPAGPSCSTAPLMTRSRRHRRHATFARAHTCDLSGPDSSSATVVAIRRRDDELDYLTLADSPLIVDIDGEVRAIADERTAHLSDYSTEGVRARATVPAASMSPAPSQTPPIRRSGERCPHERSPRRSTQRRRRPIGRALRSHYLARAARAAHHQRTRGTDLPHPAGRARRPTTNTRPDAARSKTTPPRSCSRTSTPPDAHGRRTPDADRRFTRAKPHNGHRSSAMARVP